MGTSSYKQQIQNENGIAGIYMASIASCNAALLRISNPLSVTYYLRQLDVVLIQLLLHHLLEHAEGQYLRVFDAHRFVVLVLQLSLRHLRTRPNCLSFVLDEGTRGLSMV